MTSHRHPDAGWQRLRWYGRLSAALAAGGAFAALSWESGESSRQAAGSADVQQGSQTAERQSVVKEDDASPQVSSRAVAADEYDSRGPAHLEPRPQIEPVNGLRLNVGTGAAAKVGVSTNQVGPATAATTAVPHSRGPP